MSKSVMGKRGAKGQGKQKHASRVAAQVHLADKAEKRTRAPVAINIEELEDQIDHSGIRGIADDDARAGKFRFPVSALHVGHHLQGHPADTRLKALEEYVGASGEGKPHGIVMAPTDQIIDRAMWAKEQEQYMGQLALAEHLIDPHAPETQEKAYAMFPQLQDVPDQYYQEQMALQEALRTLLRDGQIRGQEDNALIAHICSDDFVLPMLPAWDPSGVIVGKLDVFKQLMKKGYNRGLFSPKIWGAPGEAIEQQREIKKMILRRLYPGLRNSGDAALDTIIKKFSMIFPGNKVQEETFSVTQPSVKAYWDNWDWGNAPAVLGASTSFFSP